MPTDFPGYTYHRLLVGYHGCNRKTAERVLLHGDHLKKSSYRWDWLGEGIYFWEHGYQRALEFAQWKQKRGELDDPMVVGAYIHLGRCFDLTDTWATSYLAPFHQELKAKLEEVGSTLPDNRAGGPEDFDLVLRNLDCAVLNFALGTADENHGDGKKYFQSVRGVFIEGDEVYPGACIFSKTHIQIAVRDPSCILGYFRPAGGYTGGEEAG